MDWGEGGRGGGEERNLPVARYSKAPCRSGPQTRLDLLLSTFHQLISVVVVLQIEWNWNELKVKSFVFMLVAKSLALSG